MGLIYYRGLNCRLAAIINIAASLGINYRDAFNTLWSETDFEDAAKYRLYVSKRVYANLETIGLMTDTKTGRDISQIRDGELLLVGADIYYIPWHQVYNHFHGPHYFFAQKRQSSILCSDPIYKQENIEIKPDILSSAFELCHIYRNDVCPPENRLLQEAEEILRRHPDTKERLLAEILKCKDREKEKITGLIKLISALIDNRCMFRDYLYNSSPVSGRYDSFFTESFFSRWEAVRNGLYKASIVNDNNSVIDEVCGLFAALMQEEIGTAKKIIAIS